MLVRHRRRRRRRHHRRRHSSSPALSPPSTSHHPCPRRPCPRRLRYLHNSAGTIPPPSPPVAIAWDCATSCGRGARCHAVNPACAGCAQLSMDAWCSNCWMLRLHAAARRIWKAVDRSCQRFRCSASIALVCVPCGGRIRWDASVSARAAVPQHRQWHYAAVMRAGTAWGGPRS